MNCDYSSSNFSTSDTNTDICNKCHSDQCSCHSSTSDCSNSSSSSSCSSSSSSCSSTIISSCSESSYTCTEKSNDSSTVCASSCPTDSCQDCCGEPISSLGSFTSDNVNSCESCCDNGECCDDINLLPAKADIFVYKHGQIQTNHSRGFAQVPLVLGTHQCEQNKTLLEVYGDIRVTGQIYSEGQGQHGRSGFSDHVHAEHQNNQKVDYVKDKCINSLEPTINDGHLHNATYYHLSPKDNVGILYVNPIKGPIVIVLGHDNVQFKPNYVITIKDVSLNHNCGASYNVYITTNKNLYLEHYNQDCRLKVSTNGVYVLNTSNGSVSFRFYKSLDGLHNCFNIENQFIGNPRVLPGSGLQFNMAHERQVQNLLRHR